MDKYSSTEEVITAIKGQPAIAPYARRVGAWVWIDFPSKPTPDIRQVLKDMGFRWNQDRGAWQHPCGVFRHRNRRIDPRAYYGQEYVQEQLT